MVSGGESEDAGEEERERWRLRLREEERRGVVCVAMVVPVAAVVVTWPGVPEATLKRQLAIIARKRGPELTQHQ